MLCLAVLAALASHPEPAKASSRRPSSPPVAWRQFHFDAAHTGYNPFETTLSPSTVSGLITVVAVNYGSQFRYEASPIVVGDVLYITTSGAGADNQIQAMSAFTGGLLWSSSGGNCTPAVGSGGGFQQAVWFGAGNVLRLTKLDGSPIIDLPLHGGTVGSPAVSGGVEAIGAGEWLSLRDPNTGIQWAVRMPGVVVTPPAIAGATVFADAGGALSAFDEATGHVRWTRTGPFRSAPAVKGSVYVGARDGVHAYSPGDGTLEWQLQTPAAVQGTPAVADGAVYAGSDDGTLYAIEAATGTIKWTASLGASLRSSPAVANGVVYVGSAAGAVFALNAGDGSLLWTGHTAGSIGFSSPAVVNGRVFIADESGNVYGYGLPGH